MNKIMKLGLILLLILPIFASAQRYKGKDVALISYTVTIDEKVKTIIDTFGDQFPNVTNDKADKIVAKIKNIVWAMLADTLQTNVGMAVLPINTFGKRSYYDEYDFPNLGISKAQQIGYSKIFIKVDLDILTEQPVNSTGKSKLQSKSKDGDIKPFFSITITTFSVNGIIPIGKFTGTAQSEKVWDSSVTSIVDGLVNEDFKDDNSSLMSLASHAIRKISKNMQAK